MTIIFIRHGDPNYADDCLTEKGRREAQLLSQRVCEWSVDDFYCSPLGRAVETADYSMKKLGRNYEILPWLRELPARITDPEAADGSKRICWDLMPYRWTADEKLYHRTDWVNSDIMQTGDVNECCERVNAGVDELLKRYGYIRENGFFRVEENARRDAVAVCFCHFAVTSAIMSHLLNMSFPVTVHGFFMPTTSVTVLATEERREGEAYFRTQLLGDTYHLRRGGEPISHSGYFGDIFMG